MYGSQEYPLDTLAPSTPAAVSIADEQARRGSQLWNKLKSNPNALSNNNRVSTTSSTQYYPQSSTSRKSASANPTNTQPQSIAFPRAIGYQQPPPPSDESYSQQQQQQQQQQQSAANTPMTYSDPSMFIQQQQQPQSTYLPPQQQQQQLSPGEEFSKRLMEKLPLASSKNESALIKKSWVGWLALGAMILALIAAVGLIVFHSSHKSLVARVDTHAVSLERLANRSIALQTLQSDNSAVALLPHETPSNAKQRSITSKSRYPSEDANDRDIASRRHEEGDDDDIDIGLKERWKIKVFEIDSVNQNNSAAVVNKTWEEVRFDTISAYGICCRANASTKDEVLLCASQLDPMSTRLERTSTNGTRINIILSHLYSSSSRTICSFHYLYSPVNVWNNLAALESTKHK